MALGAIFGGPAPSLNFSSVQPYTSALNSIAGSYGRTAATAGGNYNLYNNANNAAIQQYANYLQQNPATNQTNAGYIAQAEQGSQVAGQQAQGQLDQQLAQQGIAPNSSAGIGGAASIKQGLAANDANIRAQLANANIAQQNQNKASLVNLETGATNNAFEQMMGAQGAQQGVNENLESTANQQALEQYNAAQNAQQQQQAYWDAIGNAAGQLSAGNLASASGGFGSPTPNGFASPAPNGFASPAPNGFTDGSGNTWYNGVPYSPDGIPLDQYGNPISAPGFGSTGY